MEKWVREGEEMKKLCLPVHEWIAFPSIPPDLLYFHFTQLFRLEFSVYFFFVSR